VALLYGALATVGVAVGTAVARDVKVASIAGALLIATLAVSLWIAVIVRERLLVTSKALSYTS
jgi:hypothetical protein